MDVAQSMDAAAGHGAGWRALFRGRNAAYSTVLGGGVALHAVNIYVATTILPSVVRDVGGLDYYAWSTTMFVVASIFGSAISAALLRRSSARGAYVTAATIFAAGTLVCALAPNMTVLLCGRAVQGLGGGLLYALAYAVIRLVFAEALWSRAIGLISALWGVATLVGPAIGGVFAGLDAWRAAFWSLVPLIAGFIWIGRAALPGSSARGEVRARLPWPQLVLLAAAVIALSLGSVAADRRWHLAGVVATVLFVAALLRIERGSRRRLLPSGALALSRPLGSLYALIALLLISMQPEIFVAYLLQRLHALTPLVAGFVSALMALGWTLGSMLSSRWQGASESRAIRGSPLLVLGGLALLWVLLPRASGATWTALLPIGVGLLLVGGGIGVAWPHIVTHVFRRAPAGEQELAAAAITTVQLFATAIGAAAAGSVANLAGITQVDLPMGVSRAASWLCAGFGSVAILAALVARRASPR